MMPGFDVIMMTNQDVMMIDGLSLMSYDWL